MKKVRIKYLLCLALGLAISPLSQAVSSGVIHFQGEIVEGGCEWSAMSANIAMTCSEKGKPITQVVTLNSLDGSTFHNDSTVQTQVKYLNVRHTLAVVQLTYQ